MKGVIKMAQTLTPFVCKKEIATHFGVSLQTISKYMRQGMPIEYRLGTGPKAPPRFDIGTCENWHRETNNGGKQNE